MYVENVCNTFLRVCNIDNEIYQTFLHSMMAFNSYLICKSVMVLPIWNTNKLNPTLKLKKIFYKILEVYPTLAARRKFVTNSALVFRLILTFLSSDITRV